MLREFKTIIKTLKAEGFRAIFKKHGWKAGALIVAYYLVRDIILYIFIPALIASR